VDDMLETALRVYRQLRRRTDTAALNQALAKWLEEYPPPQGPRKRFKVKYAVQVSDNPVKFVFFVSRPDAVSDAYKTYLCNRIRKDLGYSLIPLEAEIRPSRRDREQR
jgi:GTP-binding protein